MTHEQEVLLLATARCLLAELRKQAEIPNPRIRELADALKPFDTVTAEPKKIVTAHTPVSENAATHTPQQIVVPPRDPNAPPKASDVGAIPEPLREKTVPAQNEEQALYKVATQ